MNPGFRTGRERDISWVCSIFAASGPSTGSIAAALLPRWGRLRSGVGSLIRRSISCQTKLMFESHGCSELITLGTYSEKRTTRLLDSPSTLLKDVSYTLPSTSSSFSPHHNGGTDRDNPNPRVLIVGILLQDSRKKS